MWLALILSYAAVWLITWKSRGAIADDELATELGRAHRRCRELATEVERERRRGRARSEVSANAN